MITALAMSEYRTRLTGLLDHDLQYPRGSFPNRGHHCEPMDIVRLGGSRKTTIYCKMQAVHQIDYNWRGNGRSDS